MYFCLKLQCFAFYVSCLVCIFVFLSASRHLITTRNKRPLEARFAHTCLLADFIDELLQKTGKIGDGKIFVFDASRAVRIRTGEEGDDAL